MEDEDRAINNTMLKCVYVCVRVGERGEKKYKEGSRVVLSGDFRVEARARVAP